jgi:hypothetical protein
MFFVERRAERGSQQKPWFYLSAKHWGDRELKQTWSCNISSSFCNPLLSAVAGTTAPHKLNFLLRS